MDHELISAAPAGAVVMESAREYLQSGVIATQMALTLRNLGYEASSHIDGNYDLICPLVARDAGLGEIGRMDGLGMKIIDIGDIRLIRYRVSNIKITGNGSRIT